MWSYCQEVKLYGSATEYSGSKITFYSYNDFICKEEKELCSFIINKDGSFSCTFNLDKIEYSFTRLGIYQASVYFEPGNSYEIIFPPKVNRSPAEEQNPFFSEIEIGLGIRNSEKKGINYLINSFDNRFNNYVDKNMPKIKQGINNTITEEFISGLNQQFPDQNNNYFQNYKKYRIVYLKYFSNQRNINSIIKQYYSGSTKLTNNKAYMDLFNTLFERFLFNFSRQSEGRCLSSAINLKRDLSSIYNCLKNNDNLSDPELCELILIRGIHDSYYNNDFQKRSLLQVLDSIIEKPVLARNKKIALNLRNKLGQSIMRGKAPSFRIADMEGNMKSLNHYSGKFIYLNFFNMQDQKSLDDLKLIKELNQKHADKLRIISISTDEDIEQLKSFIRINNFSHEFLHYGGSQEIVNDYNVKSYPSYFLIGPELDVILKPAPSPFENFETLFLNIYSDRHIRDLRSKNIRK